MRLIKNNNGEYIVSAYSDEQATVDEIKRVIGKLDAAFPNSFNSAEDRARFYAVMSEIILRKKMTKKQLEAAVYNAIETCRTYKQINISDIVNYDRVRKLYTYSQRCSMHSKGEVNFKDFKSVNVDGKIYYYLP